MRFTCGCALRFGFGADVEGSPVPVARAALFALILTCICLSSSSSALSSSTNCLPFCAIPMTEVSLSAYDLIERISYRRIRWQVCIRGLQHVSGCCCTCRSVCSHCSILPGSTGIQVVIEYLVLIGVWTSPWRDIRLSCGDSHRYRCSGVYSCVQVYSNSCY